MKRLYFLNKMSFLLGCCLFLSSVQADESYGELSARVSDLENKIDGRTTSGDETVSREDFDAKIKELRGRIEELEFQLRNQSKSLVPMETPRGDGRMVIEDKEPLGQDGETQDHDDHFLQKKNDSDDEQNLDDLLNSLEESGNFGMDSREIQKRQMNETRDLATQNAEKNAPTETLDMGNGSAQYNQALALYNKKDYPEAEEAFRYYLEQFKGGKMAQQAKVKIAHCVLENAKERKDKKQAAKSVKEFAALYKSNTKGKPGAEALWGLGQAVALSGNSKKACLVLKKLTNDFPKEKEMVTKARSLMKEQKCS